MKKKPHRKKVLVKECLKPRRRYCMLLVWQGAWDAFFEMSCMQPEKRNAMARDTYLWLCLISPLFFKVYRYMCIILIYILHTQWVPMSWHLCVKTLSAGNYIYLLKQLLKKSIIKVLSYKGLIFFSVVQSLLGHFQL